MKYKKINDCFAGNCRALCVFVITMFITVICQQGYGQDDLVLENMTINTTQTFEAANSITAGPEFTISGAGKVTFKSGNTVTLTPEFVILSGGTFQVLSSETFGPVEDSQASVPGKFELCQNYPNPFNPETQIDFVIPKSSAVTLTIFNSLGQEVTKLITEHLQPGNYTVSWNADGLASGVYMYQLVTDDYAAVRKMILLR